MVETSNLQRQPHNRNFLAVEYALKGVGPMFSKPLALLLTAGFSFAFAQPQSNAMLDGTKTAVPTPSQAPKTLSPEMRGDIFMARKMYREAIETFREGSEKDAVL